MKYTFDNIEFKNQDAVKQHIRGIVNSYPADMVPINEDHFRFMLDVFRLHPRADEKIGCGIKSMWIETDAVAGNTRHFQAERVDNTNIDIGWKDCLLGDKARANLPLSYFKKAARRAIGNSNELFISSFFANPLSNKVCPYDGTLLTPDNCAVHHAIRFDELLSDYMALRGIDVLKVEIDHSGEGQTFVDDALAEDWAAYHDEHSIRHVVSKDAHNRLHGGDK